jgi:acyl-CoA synthetase (AMP-forming)/AMP-acid ligase II
VFESVPTTLRLLAGGGIHLGDLPELLARRRGARLAVDATVPVPGFGDKRSWSYADLEAAVGRMAAAQRAGGVGTGDVLLVAVANRLDALLHLFAAARLGAVACPVNPRLKRSEFEAVATAAGATMALMDRGLPSTLTAAAAAADLKLLMADGPGDGFDLVGALSADTVPASGGDPDGVVLTLCTSGTTGTPKAAALTSRGLLGGPGRLRLPFATRRDGAPRYGLLAALPLHHVMGIATALGALCSGAEWVVRERFVASEILDVLASGRVRAFVGVPTMYADLEAAGAEKRNLTSIQLWVSGADAMPPDRARRFQRAGSVTTLGRRRIGTAAFIDVYGMVELSGGAAVRVYPFTVAARFTLPVPALVFPGIRVRAVDEAGKPVGWWRRGELKFRGTTVRGLVRHRRLRAGSARRDVPVLGSQPRPIEGRGVLRVPRGGRDGARRSPRGRGGRPRGAPRRALGGSAGRRRGASGVDIPRGGISAVGPRACRGVPSSPRGRDRRCHPSRGQRQGGSACSDASG